MAYTPKASARLTLGDDTTVVSKARASTIARHALNSGQHAYRLDLGLRGRAAGKFRGEYMHRRANIPYGTGMNAEHVQNIASTYGELSSYNI